MASSTRLCVPLARPVRVPDELAFVVPLGVERGVVEQTAKAAILGSFLRPYDIQGAAIAPTILAWVPFWRVEVSASGFHVGISTVQLKSGGSSIPIPTGGANHRDAVLLVTARRNFPFEPAHVHVPGALALPASMPLRGGFQIQLSEMVPWAQYEVREGEVIDPDVTQAMAESEAKARILRSVEPSSAIYAKYEPSVRSSALCLYPLFLTTYTYEGHATGSPGDAYHVLVSGKSGQVIGEQHPSALKALARKFRRFLAS
jgi:hypothetical protein